MLYWINQQCEYYCLIFCDTSYLSLFEGRGGIGHLIQLYESRTSLQISFRSSCWYILLNGDRIFFIGCKNNFIIYARNSVHGTVI